MNPIVFALRRPYTVMVLVVAALAGSGLALWRQKVDLFPPLNQPLITICQPYGGMTPQQMEGLLTNYYEFHFLYVNGIEHVESKNVQGMTLLKLYFQPGTDMAQAMGEVVASVNRSRFMMPPGTVPPFVSRFDVGGAAVGYLVLSSDTKSIKEIQDIATLKVRPLFAGVPGLTSPPAFGGNQRAIVVSVDPDKLRGQGLTLEQVTTAVAEGNAVTPSGNLRVGDRNFLVTSNVMAGANPVAELGTLPVKTGDHPVFLRDVATLTDAADITAGYSLVDGRRSVYMLVNKRAEAGTLEVVRNLQAALPRMRDGADGVTIEFAFDQSPLVRNAVLGVVAEGAVGAVLTGLMVLLFLRDWRAVIVVVLNIPLAVLSSVFALWVTGQTLNLMTLGGLALAIGILVDEATVEVENIHTQMGRTDSLARAVRRGNTETAVPRLLAMLCVLAVFVPSFFMQGAARELFVPLSLAVGFAMIASYLLSSTFVPVLCVWLLKRGHHDDAERGLFARFRRLYGRVLAPLVAARWVVAPVYLLGACAAVALLASQLGTAVFPPTDRGMFQVRIKAPTGTRIERTETLAQEALRVIGREAGPGGVRTTVGYVGAIATNYPVQASFMWPGGPDEVTLKIALNESAGIDLPAFQNRLREVLPDELRRWLADRWAEEGVSAADIAKRSAGLRLSFEPGDLVSEVMSFGSPTPIEVQVSGSKMADNAGHAARIVDRLRDVPGLRDLTVNPATDYPTVEVSIDRERAALAGLTAKGVGNALIPATASSRYMNPIYWRDPASGQAYIVQVQVPPPNLYSPTDLGQIPLRGATMPVGDGTYAGGLLLRDVAGLRETTSPAAVDRYNMRRMVTITANLSTPDLGRVSRDVRRAVAAAGDPPKGVLVDVRGQTATLDGIVRNLLAGLAVAVVAIFLLLVAYFQSVRLALTSVAAVPATLTGVCGLLLLTGTTLNLQSFMGAIMAVGVAVANAILLVTFAERSRLLHGDAKQAARDGGTARLRAVLMTSGAMAAGMVPMALGVGEGGDQTAPLGRAVLGGVLASTLATLLAVPAVFAVLMGRTGTGSVSLDPDDPASRHHDRAGLETE
jgi:multidrug efflux pump subunit AcrB